jgi:hypothetical protein
MFKTNLKVTETVDVEHNLCHCPKCEFAFVIKAGMVKRKDDYDDRVTVDLWDQVSCNYCPRCGAPATDNDLERLKLNIECGWGRDPHNPDLKYQCAAGKHWHGDQESADQCYECGHDVNYKCPICDSDHPDSDSALMCADACMVKQK